MSTDEKRPGRPRGRARVTERDAEQRIREIEELYASLEKPQKRPAVQRDGTRRD